MGIGDEFDQWAENVREMEAHHWHTAKHALDLVPVEPGDVVLDLGCGSGYAARALRDIADADLALGMDASKEMVTQARSFTADPNVAFARGRFGHLPFDDATVDHVFSMEAFYYSSDPAAVLAEIRRVLCPGGSFFCCVNYFEENEHNDLHDFVDVDVFRWSAAEYREAFRDADFHVAAQDTIPDRETDIPPESAFPTERWDSREELLDVVETGTLLTIGVTR